MPQSGKSRNSDVNIWFRQINKIFDLLWGEEQAGEKNGEKGGTNVTEQK